MALLQIAEPDASPEPHAHRLAVGIDLGTTHTLVASVRSGVATVLADALGRPLLPSVVHYRAANAHEGENGIVVGYEAQAFQANDPRNTVASVKRFMGRGLKDIAHPETLPYDFVDEPGQVRLRTVQGTKSPVEISAEILKVARVRAEESLGGTLTGAIITVPAYFDDAQRQATKDAAKLAGINLLRLLNEPTAAAIAYGLDTAAEGIYAVYDLGGGTFDISILKLSQGVFQVLATGGDSALGGDDFDHRAYCWIIEQAKLKPVSPGDGRLLLACAREAKEFLSRHAEAPLQLRLSTGEIVALTLTTEVFDAITQHLVQKTVVACRRTLRDAGLDVTQIKGVVMVGGATRMPSVQRAVASYFGKPPLTNLDPDKAVALGAAIQANLLAGNRAAGDDWLLLDVIPLSLGLETMGGLVEKIIPRNSTIPVARAQDFTTFKEGQTALSLHVVQGERELVTDCRSLARFELHGIPAMAAGAARIRVTFQVDADGLLTVTAREQTQGVQTRIEVKPSYGLGDDEIAAMLQAGLSHAADDAKRRALREAQVEAQRLLEAVDCALREDAGLLSVTEIAQIESLRARLQSLLTVDDRLAISAALDALNQGTAEFAARRMNAGVARALSGKRPDEIQAWL